MPHNYEILRHGWGGNRRMRDDARSERIADAHEREYHPHADAKFGSSMTYKDIVESEELFGLRSKGKNRRGRLKR